MGKNREKHTFDYKFDIAGDMRNKSFNKKSNISEVKKYLNSCKIGYQIIENQITIKEEDNYIMEGLREIVRYLRYKTKNGNIIIKIL